MASSRIAFLCLLLGGTMIGQTAPPNNPTPQLKPRPAESALSGSSSVPSDTPVITVQGLCEKPAGSNATPSDCKTVITRADFEKVVVAVQPNMPKASLKQFATRYVMALMIAEKAHEQGLDQSPEFQERMYLSRLQVLDVLASEQMQRDAAKVSDSDIDDYYRQHQPDFKTITYDKLYVPRQKQADGTAQPGDPDTEKKRQGSEPEMKEEADKLRARAATGEDFNKLQQDGYDFAGMKIKPPTTHFANVAKTSVPPTEASIFELKKGEVSQVFANPQGFTIYKVEEIDDQPLANVRVEISRKLQGEKLKAFSDQLQKSASESTTYDNAYFSTPAPPTLRNPGEPTPSPNSSSTPVPGKK